MNAASCSRALYRGRSRPYHKGVETYRGAILPALIVVLMILLLWAAPVRADITVDVKGIDGELQKNVKAYIGQPDATTPQGIRQFTARIPNEADEALRALGHYHGKVRVQTRGQGGDTRVVVQVDPGPPVIVSGVDVSFSGEAAKDPVFSNLKKNIPIAAGDTLNHGTYESTKRAIQNLALGRGYFDGKFDENRIELNTETNKARIVLHYDSGARYAFGQVKLAETDLSDDLIRRMVPFKTGDPYQSSLIAALNRKLLDSGYFRHVRVRTLREQAEDHRIPVTTELTLAEPNQISIGLGFATDVGPRIKLNWAKPWVNSRGHKFQANTEISKVRKSLSAKYSIPLTDPVNDFVDIQSGWQDERFEDTISYKFMLGVQRRQVLSSGWHRTLFLRWERETFDQGGRNGVSNLYLPGVSFTRTRSRGGLDPSRGDRQLLSLEGTDTTIGSDISLLRLQVGTKWLRTFFESHRVILRADAGGIATNEFREVPPSLRFYAGGDQSVRGYDYRSLSPTAADGELVGGQYLLTGSIEYGYQFLPSWRAAVFFDAGDAFDKIPDTFHKGAGVGLRWISPVGPIRLDFAWAVSEPGKPFHLHFSMGPDL